MKKKIYAPCQVEILEIDIKNHFMVSSLRVSEEEVNGGLVKGELWFEEDVAEGDHHIMAD